MNTQTHELTLPNSARIFRVLDEVAAERARQHLLIQSGEITFDCADPAVDLRIKFPVLIEEVGEVAQLLQATAPPDTIARRMLLEQLREELLQVAAVAVAMAESLTPDSNTERSTLNAQRSTSKLP